MAYSVAAPYSTAIRSSLALWYTVDAYFAGSTVAGATDLRPVGGTITDTRNPGVRRGLSLDLSPAPGLYDLLSPIGTMLKVTANVRYSDQSAITIPMGLFDVDQQTLTEGGGKLSLTAPDKWQKVVRAKFMAPVSSTPSHTVVQQITDLIQGALPGETVNVTTSSTATVGALTWTDGNRDKAILDLANGAGLWVYADRTGTFTIADAPTIGSSADWVIDASATGVLVTLDRSRSRTDTCNVVVLESSAATSSAPFATVIVWDNDSSSPTYAGTDPVAHPELAGPFGVVPYLMSSSLALTSTQAHAAAMAQLYKVCGLASQVSLTAVPNPAIDAGDFIDVLPPMERADLTRTTERHITDTVVHPLAFDQAQHIDGRSVRTTTFA